MSGRMFLLPETAAEGGDQLVKCRVVTEWQMHSLQKRAELLDEMGKIFDASSIFGNVAMGSIARQRALQLRERQKNFSRQFGLKAEQQREMLAGAIAL